MIKYFELLNFNGRAERLNLWRGSAGASERHGAARPAARTVPAEDAFLYTLIMAKSGLTFEQGATLLGVDRKSGERIFKTWCTFMRDFARALMPFPTKEQVQRSAPAEWEAVRPTPRASHCHDWLAL